MATKQEYKFVNEIPGEYLCAICKGVLEEPHATDCCGQHFCQECLEKSFENLPVARKVLSSRGKTDIKQCPHCRRENFNHMKYLPIQRKISDLKVYCPHKGCTATVRRGDIESHKHKCDYATVMCTNNCGEQLLRKELKIHLDKKCRRRQVKCDYCGREGKFYRVTGSHQNLCTKFPLACGNKCGKVDIKREDMQQHKAVCPLEMVKCPYSDVGCKDEITRKDLGSHVENSLQKHLAQLMSAHIQLTSDHKKLKEEFERYKSSKEPQVCDSEPEFEDYDENYDDYDQYYDDPYYNDDQNYDDDD